MPITVCCSKCGETLRLSDELAGRTVRCKSCPNPIRVPDSAGIETVHAEERPTTVTKKKVATNQPRAKKQKKRKAAPAKSKFDAYSKRWDMVLAAFETDFIAPVPLETTYKIGIVLVTLLMLMLPLAYVGLIGVLTFSVPILAPILLFLLVKPLFARGEKKTGRRSLKREDEPLLFDFVEQICDAIDAPYPRRIDIDSQVNASASFRNGLLSFFGNDLVLTIGMPLVAGLNMRQFAGVLAHEFGHFAQGAGMRLTLVMRAMSYWFTRIVYERDVIDGWLENLSVALPIQIGIFLWIIRGLFWLARKILWCFMMLGHLVSHYMLRQMEFDADRYEARLAGSKAFVQTARKLTMLSVAHHGAFEDLADFYREGRLADNFPRLIIANADQLDDKMKKKIRELSRKEETELFSTHPSEQERVASARAEKSEGIFRLEKDATALFRRFDYLAKAVTWDMYRENLGEELRKSDIHPLDELLVRQQHQQENFKALYRFFQGVPAWYRPLKSPQIALKRPENVKGTGLLLQRSRKRMLALADGYKVSWKRYDKADTRLIECELAQALLKLRLKIPKDMFSVPLRNGHEVRERMDAAEYIQGRQESKLGPFEKAAADRLYAALRLLRVPGMEKRIPQMEDLLDEVDEMVELFDHVNERLGQLLAIRNDQIVMGKLLMTIDGNEDNHRLFVQIENRMAELSDLILDLLKGLKHVPYPFDHADEDMNMAQYMLASYPDPQNPIELFEAAGVITGSLPPLQARVLGRLCQIAEEAETALGLKPLPDPELDDDDEEEEAGK